MIKLLEMGERDTETNPSRKRSPGVMFELRRKMTKFLILLRAAAQIAVRVMVFKLFLQRKHLIKYKLYCYVLLIFTQPLRSCLGLLLPTRTLEAVVYNVSGSLY